MTRVPVLCLAIAVAFAACERSKSSSSAMPNRGVPAPTAPAVVRVRFETSKGPFVVEAHRDWAPNGVDRFYQLVRSGFFDSNRFFRVIPGFVVQVGLHGEPEVATAWEPLAIPDDPVAQSNRRGTVTFATAGPNTRTTQLFINLQDNASLDGMGFAPIGTVVEGMAVVDSLYSGYGDAPPNGSGPEQARIRQEGNAYLEREFPKLDFVRRARIISGTATDSARRDTSKS